MWTVGEHLFRLDDSRSNVVVHRNPEKVGGGLHHGYRAVNTLTCRACGIRLAWIPTADGRVEAAHGMELDVLAYGRPPAQCEGMKGVEVDHG